MEVALIFKTHGVLIITVWDLLCCQTVNSIESLYFYCKYSLFFPPAAFSSLISRSQSEHNPWVALTSALLSRCQGSEVKLKLGQEVVAMVRSLYNTKHKLPAPVSNKWCDCEILKQLMNLKCAIQHE